MAGSKDRQRALLRARRHSRVRSKVAGTGDRPRLAVFRSIRNISAQVIDDSSGRTLVAVASSELELRQRIGPVDGGNLAGAQVVGEVLAQRAKEAGITRVVFDRGGFAYHGRVARLADAARAKGLEL